MAYMIPSNLKNQPDTTAGERKLFDLFRTAFPDTCVVRYEMLLGARHYRPDYTLVDSLRGILVVEIKDWGISTIKKATAEQFFIQYSGGAPQPQPNPNKKCQVYLRHTREALSAMPILQGEGLGELQSPLEYLIAFPNISKAEFVDQRFDQLIPLERVLLKEDLARSGKPFRDRYEQILPALDPPLTREQAQAIRQALFPNNGFALNVAGGFIPQDAEGIVIDGAVEPLHLSLEQEQIAKSLGEGPRLLRGIAGTGKTLIMLYRAKLLAANDPDIKILILCWNISLANYMRQAYDKLQFQAQGRVNIQHFADFVRDLFGQHRVSPYDFDNPRFQRQLESLRIENSEKYDAIYIDEAQDFRKEWIAFIYHRLLKGEPEARNLLVAADDAQRIYHARDFSWASLDIPMVGRSKILKTVYRNAARVWVFSAFLLREKASYLHENKDHVTFSQKGGYDPQLIECESLTVQIERAIEIIKSVRLGGFAARNVLVLYKGKTVDGFPLVERLITRLNEEGIRSDWIAEDRAKRTFEWDAETVKISTVHSAKGMDSPVVIILGAETFREIDPSRPASGVEYDELKLMYVAMTRAREFLVILHTGDGGMVPQLRHCQEEYKKHRHSIIGLEGGE